jgi:hypothetical protein
LQICDENALYHAMVIIMMVFAIFLLCPEAHDELNMGHLAIISGLLSGTANSMVCTQLTHHRMESSP